VNGSTVATPLKVICHTVYHQKLWFVRWIRLHRRGRSWSVNMKWYFHYTFIMAYKIKGKPRSLLLSTFWLCGKTVSAGFWHSWYAYYTCFLIKQDPPFVDIRKIVIQSFPFAKITVKVHWSFILQLTSLNIQTILNTLHSMINTLWPCSYFKKIISCLLFKYRLTYVAR
jgi:hypothetical protein